MNITIFLLTSFVSAMIIVAYSSERSSSDRPSTKTIGKKIYRRRSSTTVRTKFKSKVVQQQRNKGDRSKKKHSKTNIKSKNDRQQRRRTKKPNGYKTDRTLRYKRPSARAKRTEDDVERNVQVSRKVIRRKMPILIVPKADMPAADNRCRQFFNGTLTNVSCQNLAGTNHLKWLSNNKCYNVSFDSNTNKMTEKLVGSPICYVNGYTTKYHYNEGTETCEQIVLTDAEAKTKSESVFQHKHECRTAHLKPKSTTPRALVDRNQRPLALACLKVVYIEGGIQKASDDEHCFLKDAAKCLREFEKCITNPSNEQMFNATNIPAIISNRDREFQNQHCSFEGNRPTCSHFSDQKINAFVEVTPRLFFLAALKWCNENKTIFTHVAENDCGVGKAFSVCSKMSVDKADEKLRAYGYEDHNMINDLIHLSCPSGNNSDLKQCRRSHTSVNTVCSSKELAKHNVERTILVAFLKECGSEDIKFISPIRSCSRYANCKNMSLDEYENLLKTYTRISKSFRGDIFSCLQLYNCTSEGETIRFTTFCPDNAVQDFKDKVDRFRQSLQSDEETVNVATFLDCKPKRSATYKEVKSCSIYDRCESYKPYEARRILAHNRYSASEIRRLHELSCTETEDGIQNCTEPVAKLRKANVVCIPNEAEKITKVFVATVPVCGHPDVTVRVTRKTCNDIENGFCAAVPRSSVESEDVLQQERRETFKRVEPKARSSWKLLHCNHASWTCIDRNGEEHKNTFCTADLMEKLEAQAYPAYLAKVKLCNDENEIVHKMVADCERFDARFCSKVPHKEARKKVDETLALYPNLNLSQLYFMKCDDYQGCDMGTQENQNSLCLPGIANKINAGFNKQDLSEDMRQLKDGAINDDMKSWIDPNTRKCGDCKKDVENGP